MKCHDSYDAHKYWKSGDFVWATAFKLNQEHTALLHHQKPIYGMLASSKHASTHAAMMAAHGHPNILYFVPCKKGSTTELAWSKTVHAHSRKFADTEAEAVELYNETIQSVINWHLKNIDNLRAKLLRPILRTESEES